MCREQLMWNDKEGRPAGKESDGALSVNGLAGSERLLSHCYPFGN